MYKSEPNDLKHAILNAIYPRTQFIVPDIVPTLQETKFPDYDAYTIAQKLSSALYKYEYGRCKDKIFEHPLVKTIGYKKTIYSGRPNAVRKITHFGKKRLNQMDWSYYYTHTHRLKYRGIQILRKVDYDNYVLNPDIYNFYEYFAPPGFHLEDAVHASNDILSITTKVDISTRINP